MIKKPLLLFIFICIAYSCSPVKKYTSLAQSWEKDIQQFEALPKVGFNSKDALLFIGSSSIRLWTTIEEDMAPYPVIQRGYGGASYADLAYHIERIVYPHQFKALVIFAGNDIWGNETDRSPKEIARLLKHIVHRVNKKYKETPVFVIEVTHTPARLHLMPEINAENKALKTVCDQFGWVYWIPTSHVYLTSKNKANTVLFSKDQIHQNQKGYQQWAKLIKQKIKSVLH